MHRRAGSIGPRWIVFCIAAFLFVHSAIARPWWVAASASNAQGFLPVDQAFRVSARRVGRRLVVHWDIARGYYLYRSRIGIRVLGSARLASGWRLPAGAVHTDRYFGPQQVYFHSLDASAELAQRPARGAAPELEVSFQGCALAGLCYPRVAKRIAAARAGSSAPQAPAR